MGKGGLIILGLLAVAGCSSASSAPTAPRIVEQARQNQPVGARLPQTDADMCKAGELQWLVGKPRTEIPVPVDVVNRRVACTTCPVTEDYSPYRLNIFYNQQTGIVERVSCG
ncbi:hypothetical protein [Brevundimonas sp.]|uniref:hypothetical protein n=1 Tax=Brevundimonas sp. TaxID=1871086 RepID=UPI003D6D9EC8